MFNVTRPKEIPACLTNGKYNDKEVVEALYPMFYGKCYLCEQDELADPEIEHFDPHQGDNTKKLDWNNLFLSCSRCNSIKSTTHKDLLNCCRNDIDVFRAIKCLMPSAPDENIQVTAQIANNKNIERTVNLLKQCYNSESTPLRGVTRSVLVEKLFTHYTDFLSYRRTIRDKRSTDEEVEHAKKRLIAMLKISFPFSVFWKWHILSDSFLSKEMKGDINF